MPQAVTVQVIRVTRPDTLLLRTDVPELQGRCSIYGVLGEVRCRRSARQEIVDWVEAHADFGRLGMLTWNWCRDPYGRLLCDLADLQSGETLTGYLIDRGVAAPRPSHYVDCLAEMMTAQEVRDADW
jgi:hypothetical protein